MRKDRFAWRTSGFMDCVPTKPQPNAAAAADRSLWGPVTMEQSMDSWLAPGSTSFSFPRVT